MRFAVIFMSIFFCVQNSFAAEDWKIWRGSRGWGMDSAYQKGYQTDHACIVSGSVVGFEKIVPIKGMCSGIALKLKTEEENLQVHLGPTWYIERLEFGISKGDKLEIKGVRTVLNNREIIMAAEVRNGNRFLILRDNAGIPVWTGWGWKR